MNKRRQCVLILVCSAAAIAVSALAEKSAPTVHFLSKTYHLVSFTAKDKPTWQFFIENESADNWTSMLRIVEPPDAHSLKDVDKVCEDLKAEFVARKGTPLGNMRLQGSVGEFTYLIFGIDDAAQHRYDLHFIKVAVGRHSVYVVDYAVRTADPGDYAAKTKAFLRQKSQEIGKALGEGTFPETSRLPRTE